MEDIEKGPCPICLEEFDVESGRGAIRLRPCGHQYCHLCLNEYVRLAIGDRKVPIPCPNFGEKDSACEEHVSEDIVEYLLHDEQSAEEGLNKDVWRKFKRFLAQAADPLLVVCPWCDDLVSPGTEGVGNSNRLCQSCDRNFCAIHGLAHLGTTCQEYKKTKTAKQIEKSEVVVLRWTKPCSRCDARIYKASGCDHVVCPSCNEDMCYRCGTHIHLSGKITRTCAKCQQGFLDHRYDCQYRLRLCIYLPLFLPLILLYIVVGLLMAAVTLCFGCCFGCGYCVPGKPSELAPLRGIGACAEVVFMPLIGLLEQFGFTWGFGEDGDGDRGSIREIPTMALDESASDHS